MRWSITLGRTRYVRYYRRKDARYWHSSEPTAYRRIGRTVLFRA